MAATAENAGSPAFSRDIWRDNFAIPTWQINRIRISKVLIGKSLTFFIPSIDIYLYSGLSRCLHDAWFLNLQTANFYTSKKSDNRKQT